MILSFMRLTSGKAVNLDEPEALEYALIGLFVFVKATPDILSNWSLLS